MTSILDIGRSGVMAYRQSLSVTAENIANVGTEGYRRRDVSTVTLGGARATPVTAPTGGQGVSVVDVRRAFDALATDRARSAAADQAAAQTHLDSLRAIETLMIPGDDGIDGSLRQFFDGLAALAANPTDPVTRAQTLRRGEALGEALSSLAQGFGQLRADMMAQAGQTTRDAGAILAELAELSRRMPMPSDTNAAAAAALHPLADHRDLLLDKLGQLLPVAVELDRAGRPTIRLGNDAGPLLLQADRPADLSIGDGAPLTLQIRAQDQAPRETRLLSSAMLGGLSRGLAALDMASDDLDGFARALSESLNALHRRGIDQNGDQGGDMFVMDGWRASPAAGNTGRFSVVVTPLSGDAMPTPIDLVYDGAAQVWQARDGGGNLIASGAETLLLPQARVDLAGLARSGDRVTLTAVTGQAADLRWAIRDPSALAAASAFAVAPSAQNAGSATLAAMVQPLPAMTQPVLTADFAQPPLDLLGGPVGLIRAGSTAVDLASLGSVATSTLAWPATGATQLDLDLGASGGVQSFDLTGLADADAVLAALQSGQLRSQRGQSLAQMGVVAARDAAGALVLQRPDPATPVGATLTHSGGVITATQTQGTPAGGMVQIITRNGQHVAGAPLTAAQAAALITPAGGFLDGAVYDPQPLLAGSGTGYRNLAIDDLAVSVGQRLTLANREMVTGADLPLPSLAPRVVTLGDATGAVTQVDLPQGASAALVAARISAAHPAMDARASTAVEITGFGTAGPVGFSLTGVNGAALAVQANLTDADATPLAQAINAISAATGISASLSPDGARLMLVQADGHDIALSDLRSADGAGLVVRAVAQTGQPAGADHLWTDGTALRQGGQVQLDAARSFDLTEAGIPVASQPAASGGVTQTRFAAGAGAQISFAPTPDLAQGGLSYQLTLDGRTLSVAHGPASSGAVIAASLAQTLRATAADTVVTGAALAQLPSDGRAMLLTLEGASYTLRMDQGAPVITGPEPERISASFDAQNRLVLRANGVSDGAGIGIGLGAAAADFGLDAGQAGITLQGKAPDPALLPADVTLRADGVDYTFGMTAGGGLTQPAGFPGQASRDALTGALQISLTGPVADLRLTGAAGSGMDGPNAAVRIVDGDLVLQSAGPALDLDVAVKGPLAQVLRLTDLPPEDLIVLMTGDGTQRLAGGVTAGAAPLDPGALQVQVTDAARGLVQLRDSITGDIVANGVLDATGRASLGGLSVQLDGRAADGDRFAILPSDRGSADAGVAAALAALRRSDPATGQIGMTDRFSTFSADLGLRVAAADRSAKTADASAEAAVRAQAAIGAVDLDKEAAHLLELQQAYQANAQTMTIARDLFETLLRLL
jgi:flagellar hook-associated protein 1